MVFSALGGGPQSPRAFSKEWAAAAAALSVPEVTLHALRHTHASQLIDAGLDIVKVSKRLGHAKPSITLQIYAHVFGADDASVVAALNASLPGSQIS